MPPRRQSPQARGHGVSGCRRPQWVSPTASTTTGLDMIRSCRTPRGEPRGRRALRSSPTAGFSLASIGAGHARMRRAAWSARHRRSARRGRDGRSPRRSSSSRGAGARVAADGQDGVVGADVVARHLRQPEFTRADQRLPMNATPTPTAFRISASVGSPRFERRPAAMSVRRGDSPFGPRTDPDVA